MLFACDSNIIEHNNNNNNDNPPTEAGIVKVNYYDGDELLQSFDVDKSIIDLNVLPEFDVPEKKGYENGAWYYKKSSKNLESIDIGYAYKHIKTDIEGNKSINIYAKYNIITYKIAYKFDKSISDHNQYIFDNNKDLYRTSYTVEDEFNISNLEEEWFDYWETADGKEIATISKGTVGDLVLTAKQRTYKVTYKDWNDTVLEEKYVPSRSYVKYKDGAGENPTRTGTDEFYYNFTGWAPYSNSSEGYYITEDTEFTANYRQIYYYSFSLLSSGDKYALTSCNINEGEVVVPSEYKGLPVTKICTVAFYNSQLTSIVIPEGVKTIDQKAFYNCPNLEKITIPSTVNSLYEAIYKCPKLKTAGPVGGGYNIEYSWTESLPYMAFYLDNLEKLVIPGSITTVEQQALYAPKLKTAGPIGGGYDIEFGWTTEIPDKAFYCCHNLRSITIPNTVTKLGAYAFHNIIHLYSIVIPASVTTIGKECFSQSWQLTEVFNLSNCYLYVAGALTNTDTLSESKIVNKDGYVYYIDGANKYLIDYDGKEDEIELDNDTTSVYGNSLEFRYHIKTIIIPTSVTHIGSRAFSDDDLENIVYKGTKAQWDEITIGWNWGGENATLTCLGDLT